MTKNRLSREEIYSVASRVRERTLEVVKEVCETATSDRDADSADKKTLEREAGPLTRGVGSLIKALENRRKLALCVADIVPDVRPENDNGFDLALLDGLAELATVINAAFVLGGYITESPAWKRSAKQLRQASAEYARKVRDEQLKPIDDLIREEPCLTGTRHGMRIALRPKSTIR